MWQQIDTWAFFPILIPTSCRYKHLTHKKTNNKDSRPYILTINKRKSGENKNLLRKIQSFLFFEQKLFPFLLRKTIPWKIQSFRYFEPKPKNNWSYNMMSNFGLLSQNPDIINLKKFVLSSSTKSQLCPEKNYYDPTIHTSN